MKKFNGTISRSGALYYVNVEWCGIANAHDQ